jgi:membrane carboxypeptidase/penicillin-binding protein PbpC
MNITITLTEAEAKALAYVAASPTEWAENAVHERARVAMDEIFQLEVQRMLADPNTTEIPADREAVVLASTLPTAAERHEQALLDLNNDLTT